MLSAGRSTNNRRVPWIKILILSIPLALILQVALLVVIALISGAPHIVCTASVEAGGMARPCGLGQLIAEWSQMTILYNALLLGVPTLISYPISVAILFASSKAYFAFSSDAQ
jgi:hypothetical protein